MCVNDPGEPVIIELRKTSRLDAASITEDPTLILVGESLQEHEGKTLRMDTAADLVSPRRDGILEGRWARIFHPSR